MTHTPWWGVFEVVNLMLMFPKADQRRQARIARGRECRLRRQRPRIAMHVVAGLLMQLSCF